MRKTTKTAIALLCTLVMFGSPCAFAVDEPSGDKQPPGSDTETTTVTYTYIEFGSYPQTEVVSQASDSGVYGKAWATESDYIVDATLYTTLTSLAENQWDANGDATVGGNKYRRIKASDATYIKAADTKSKDSGATDGESTGNIPTENDIIDMYYNWSSTDAYHYFKYEPIKWRVLDQSGDDYFLLSETVLDDQQYNEELNGEITWENSTIRSWLNGYDSSNNFIDTAFTVAEQAKIKTTTIANKNNTSGTIVNGNDTRDKIYLLSDDEVNTAEYGFSSNQKNNTTRQATSSTYAKAMGAKSNNDGNGYWWLRSAGAHPGLFALIRDSGTVYDGGQHANSKSRGVRPAMHISLSDGIVSFTVGGETTLSSLPTGSFDAKLYIANGAGNPITVLLAAYTSDGRFCGMQTKVVETSGYVTFTVDNSGGNIGKLSAFAITDLQTALPLTASVTYGG